MLLPSCLLGKGVHCHSNCSATSSFIINSIETTEFALRVIILGGQQAGLVTTFVVCNIFTSKLVSQIFV